jgi:hypothetical protein
MDVYGLGEVTTTVPDVMDERTAFAYPDVEPSP